MQEEAPVEEVWDIRKIILGVIVVIIISVFLYMGKDILQKNLSSSKSVGQVEGVSTQKPINLPPSSQLRDEAKEKLDLIKKEIENLNAAELASSSPQVQKIIKDLQDLEKYPSIQIKDFCQNICKSL